MLFASSTLWTSQIGGFVLVVVINYCWVRRHTLIDTMHLSISFRKVIPPKNRQPNVLISNSNHSSDDFVGELTF